LILLTQTAYKENILPNWCNNELFIQHEDTKMIKRAKKAFNKGKLLNEFYPVPKELMDTISGNLGDGYAQELNQFKMQLNMKYFGVKDWYDWCVKYWGTKWDISPQTIVEESATSLHLSFDTAWSPPLEFYGHLLTLGFTVDATYYESGMGFCGAWHDGCDEFYQIEGGSQWVIDNIPSEIDEIYCISSDMAEWEEENEV
jgi:hypothetical protein